MANFLLKRKSEMNTEMLEVVSFFSNKFLNSVKGTDILLVISDENGNILDMVGDEAISLSFKEFGIQPGSSINQDDIGMNIISLALQERKPVQLIGEDHTYPPFKSKACYGLSFRYTDIDKLLGSISIITSIEMQNVLFLSILFNIADSIERELLLREQNRKLNIISQVMLSKTRNAIIITDAEGKVTEYNHFAEVLSGFTREEIIGKDIFASPRTGAYFREVIENKVVFKDVEFKFVNNNGETLTCLFDAQPIYDDENASMIGAFAQLRNITERVLLEEKYNYLAFHDELTGIPNRRHFQNELKHLIEEKSSDIALLLVDLDRFKIINDTFGHSCGDRLLVQVTERIKTCIPKEDMLARISGDEFIILLKNKGQLIEDIADQIIHKFDEPFLIKENKIHASVSIGVAHYQANDVPSLEDFFVQVDVAMYKAKSQGKNCYIVYTPEMYKDMSEELLLESYLRKALERNEFRLYFQAQVNSKTGEMIGVEALLRWVHPELGVIPPDKFIPLAERTGLIVSIGEWVIEEACRQNKEWMTKGLPPKKISINLSIQQFLKQNIVEVIKGILERTKLEPLYLELEITESMAMDFNYAEQTINQLRNIGVQISMDDFGTGYSSLSYLKRFSINCLKIDKSFVTDILTDESDAKIVGTIIAMANNLGIMVIAEGVETKGQLQFLSDKECFDVQGYYFMKPCPAKEFEEKYLQLAKEFKRKSKEVM